MSTPALHVLGISGSLRKHSFNTAILRAAIELAPEGMTVEVGEIGEIPLYDDDVHARGLPPPVAKLREQVATADAILIVTPEYNYSIPGVLKNAIDWLSRPPKQPFAHKPLAIMGASGGPSGTVRAQYHLRQIAVALDMHPLNRPEVFVRSAAERINADGIVTDESTRKAIADQLVALAAWTKQLRPQL
jgi:chromate reductase